MPKVVVTGGAGFIGSNLVELLVNSGYEVAVLDKLTYAGRIDNIEHLIKTKDVRFVLGDVCDMPLALSLYKEYDVVVHMAAESHVDRSLTGPEEFVRTEVLGVLPVLEAAKQYGRRVLVVSTDEVYGSVTAPVTEKAQLLPCNPYSGAKAAAEMMCRAYMKTYEIDIVIARPSNNLGPRQHPEKLVSKAITNLLKREKVPVYGKGLQIRDWIYVSDCCAALKILLELGKSGEAYNVTANQERQNIETVHRILACMGSNASAIRFVEDRQGHDFRYSMDAGKLRSLGWDPEVAFDEAIERTVKWYQENEVWWRKTHE